ncbi:MAG: hypothetical protein GX811_00785, partial [Lentisphaerae bacterium]|nr:hypothetical protein [Lentisphaerota bacterium]
MVQVRRFFMVLIAFLYIGNSCKLCVSYAEDELDAILRGIDLGEDVIKEQLKSADTLINAVYIIPGTKDHDHKAEAKAHSEGVKQLDEIETISGLGVEVLAELYRLRQVQYAKVNPDTLKYEEYTNKILALPECPESVKQKALNDLADLGGPWSLLSGYYVFCLPEEQIEKRKQNYREFHEKKYANVDLKLNPEHAAGFNYLGRSYWEDGENEKAEIYLLAVFNQKDNPRSRVNPGRIGDAAVMLASIEVRRGNRDKARQYCQDLIDKGYENLSNSKVHYSVPGAHAEKAVRHLKDDYMPDLDNLKLPHWTDCKPYPQPQEPEYTDKYTQLKSVRFEGSSEFPKDHPVFRLIELKFKRYGIAIADNAPFTIKLNTARHPSTPKKHEGYYLEITDREAIISGNDFQGSVWGVVSFIQCVDSATAKVRNCKVRDWPATPLRGHSGYGDDLVEFGLFNKFNFFFNQTYCFLDAGLPDLDLIYE